MSQDHSIKRYFIKYYKTYTYNDLKSWSLLCKHKDIAIILVDARYKKVKLPKLGPRFAKLYKIEDFGLRFQKKQNKFQIT